MGKDGLTHPIIAGYVPEAIRPLVSPNGYDCASMAGYLSTTTACIIEMMVPMQGMLRGNYVTTVPALLRSLADMSINMVSRGLLVQYATLSWDFQPRDPMKDEVSSDRDEQTISNPLFKKMRDSLEFKQSVYRQILDHFAHHVPMRPGIAIFLSGLIPCCGDPDVMIPPPAGMDNISSTTMDLLRAGRMPVAIRVTPDGVREILSPHDVLKPRENLLVLPVSPDDWRTSCPEADHDIILWMMIYLCCHRADASSETLDARPRNLGHQLVIFCEDNDVFVSALVNLEMAMPSMCIDAESEEAMRTAQIYYVHDHTVGYLYKDGVTGGVFDPRSGQRACQVIKLKTVLRVLQETLGNRVFNKLGCGPLMFFLTLLLCRDHDYHKGAFIPGTNLLDILNGAIARAKTWDPRNELFIFDKAPAPNSTVFTPFDSIGVTVNFANLREFMVLACTNTGAHKKLEWKSDALFRAHAKRLSLWLSAELNRWKFGWKMPHAAACGVRDGNPYSLYGYKMVSDKKGVMCVPQCESDAADVRDYYEIPAQPRTHQ